MLSKKKKCPCPALLAKMFCPLSKRKTIQPGGWNVLEIQIAWGIVKCESLLQWRLGWKTRIWNSQMWDLLVKKQDHVCSFNSVLSLESSKQTKTLLQWRWRRRSWTFMRALKRPAGGNVCGWKVVSRGYWADDSESSCGKRSLVMRATGERSKLWRERTRPVYVNWGDRWQMESPEVTGRRSRLLLLRTLWFSFLQHASAHSRLDLVTDVLSHAACAAPILSQGYTLINPWQKEQHITPGCLQPVAPSQRR